MSLEDVAKVTKIQPRILERLEAGKLDGLPAEVFVRGFVRSFARCVGLDEGEALRRYAACGLGSQDLTPTVRALVEAMADLAPGSATAARATPRKMHAVEVIDLAGDASARDLSAMSASDEASPEPARRGSQPAIAVQRASTAPILPEPSHPHRTSPGADAEAADEPRFAAGSVLLPPPVIAAAVPALAERAPAAPAAQSATPGAAKKKRGRRRKARAAGAPGASAREHADAPVAAELPAVVARDSIAVGTPATPSPVVAEIAPESCADAAAAMPEPVEPPAGASAPGHDAASIDVVEASARWAPTMPPLAAAPSVPWRRPAQALAAVSVAPAAAIAPSLVIDDADPESAERVLEERAENLAPRRSFLPPILLDREDRSSRQGGLTLAVILLLIAATLTLSYLMRRPGAGGDGMTVREAPAIRVG